MVAAIKGWMAEAAACAPKLKSTHRQTPELAPEPLRLPLAGCNTKIKNDNGNEQNDNGACRLHNNSPSAVGEKQWNCYSSINIYLKN